MNQVRVLLVCSAGSCWGLGIGFLVSGATSWFPPPGWEIASSLFILAGVIALGFAGLVGKRSGNSG